MMPAVDVWRALAMVARTQYVGLEWRGILAHRRRGGRSSL